PAGLILTHAVLQNQQRVAAPGRLVVAGRRVNESTAPGRGGFGEVPFLAHLPVRYVPDGVEVDSGLRNLDATGFLAVAEVSLATRVVDRDAIKNEPVVVKASHRRRNRHAPRPIGTLGHRKRALPQAIAATQRQRVRLRSIERESDTSVGVNSGTLSSRDVRS